MGLVGDWTLPRFIGRDYLKQVTVERREENIDTAGAFTTSGNTSAATTCSIVS